MLLCVAGRKSETVNLGYSLIDELHKIECRTREIYPVIKTKCVDMQETDKYNH
jgi:hypothetical protein